MDVAIVAREETEGLLDMVLGGVEPRSDWYMWCERKNMYVSSEALSSALLQRSSVGSGGGGRRRGEDGDAESVASSDVGNAGERSTALSGGKVVVIDTRDDDVAGGMIHGALHCPDGEFGAQTILGLLDRTSSHDPAASASASASAPTHSVPSPTPTPNQSTSSITISTPPKTTFVFHCMESARRAPRCARKMWLALEALTDEAHPLLMHQQVVVKVLTGGFDQWVRRHWKDPALVRGYDSEYWFMDDDEGEEEEVEEGAGVREAVDPRVGAGHGANDVDTVAAKAKEEEAHRPVHHRLYARPHDQLATPWSPAGAPAAMEGGVPSSNPNPLE
jgi:rhodanese-related sulfurtransferase